MDEINIDDFMKVDLRIAKVKEAIEVPEADKLVKYRTKIDATNPEMTTLLAFF